MKYLLEITSQNVIVLGGPDQHITGNDRQNLSLCQVLPVRELALICFMIYKASSL